MINVNTFKPGLTFKDGDDIFVVIESQHSQQARGQANVRVKIKNLRTGAIVMKTYTGGERVDDAHIQRHDMDFLYSDGNNVVLMDKETFEQYEISLERLKWELNFMTEGMEVVVQMYEKEFLMIELPTNVPIKVIEAPEAIKGNSISSNPSKRIKVATGFELDAPMFIKNGETILVSSVTGKYVGRA